MHELRSFLAAEIAAGRGFYPPGAARLQRAAADAVRRRPRGDSRAGSLPRPRAGDGAVRSRCRPACRRRRRSATSSPSSAPTSVSPCRATGDLTAVGRARRAAPQQRADRRPAEPASHAGKGWEAVHRSCDRRALGTARGHRLPALGTLRPAEGSDRRHDAPPRAHRRPSVPVLGEQRLLRLPPLLPGERAARGRGLAPVDWRLA